MGGCDFMFFQWREKRLASLPQPHSHLLPADPITPSNPFQGCRNQSPRRNVSASRREKGSCKGSPGVIWFLDLQDVYIGNRMSL